MKLESTDCPHCGAPVEIKQGMSNTTCPYCGMVLSVQNEAQQASVSNAEEAGYHFEMGRQRARAEVNRYQQQVRYTEPKKKAPTWLWVLGWIFLFPIPATVLLVRNKKINPVVKAFLIIFVWIIYLRIAR